MSNFQCHAVTCKGKICKRSKHKSNSEFCFQHMKNTKTDECVICYNEINSNLFSTLCCGHKFCLNCVSKWFFVNRGLQKQCPLCRKNQSEDILNCCKEYCERYKLIKKVYVRFLNGIGFYIAYLASAEREKFSKRKIEYFRNTFRSFMQKYKGKTISYKSWTNQVLPKLLKFNPKGLDTKLSLVGYIISEPSPKVVYDDKQTKDTDYIHFLF